MAEMFLTVEQAAERLQLHPATVRKQLRSGALRGVRRGRVYRIPESALLQSTPPKDTAPSPGAALGHLSEADSLWAEMTSGDPVRGNAARIALAGAPEAVRSEIIRRSAEATAKFYAMPEGEAEWRETVEWMNGAAGPLLDEPIETATTAAALSPQEITGRMNALAALLDDLPNNRAQAGLPPLTDEDISPEAIYGDD